MIAMMVISMAVTSTAFTYKVLHPCALFPYHRAAIDSDIARPFVNPAYIYQYPSFIIDMNYAKPYNLEGLSASSIYVGTSFNDYGAMIAWNSFGIDEYKEDTFESAIGFRFFNLISFGIAPQISKISINTDLVDFNHNFFNMRAGIAITPCKWIEFSYHQENIRSVFLEEARDIHYPTWSAGTIIRPALGFSCSWNINKTYFSYINSVAVSANILKWLSVSGGYSRETHSIAGAVSILIKGIIASYGLRYHSYLGSTHSFAITVRFGSSDLEEISYSKPRKPQCIEPINVKTCSSEELTRLGISPLVADRIVKYRETVGPISRKSLIQMGLTSKEYKRLSHCFVNLEDDSITKKNEVFQKKSAAKTKISKNTKQEFPFRNAERRKLLFQKLVQAGVKATSALRISELAKDITRQKLIDSIDHLSFLNDSEKRAAKKVCASQ